MGAQTGNGKDEKYSQTLRAKQDDKGGKLDNQGVIGALRDSNALTEQLNEFFALVFTAQDAGEIPTTDQSLLVDGSEELDCTEVTAEEVLKRIDNLNAIKSTGPDGVPLSSEGIQSC